ncbi:MAG TPA: FHA domain-containing protein [Planctomycetota bacterium]|nr:FHA domain-containing protein [Planctomycetota bacterium]
MIKLLVKFGNESREVEIKEIEISIGRAADNVLPLADKKSSRKHAKIEKVGDEYRVNDLGSGNGTKVNGKDVNTHVLAKGDEIAIGLTSIYVLAMDTPPKAAPAPASSPAALAVTVPASAGVAPAAPRTDDKPAENAVEARRKQTRRALARSNSGNWAGTLISAIVLAGIVGVGYHFYAKHEKETQAKRDAKLELEQASTKKIKDAEAEFNKFKARTDTNAVVEDSIIAEATALSQTYGATYPAFDTLVSHLKQRRAEQIGRDDFATVDARVQAALSDRRFGDALEALKDMKAATEPAMAGGLVTKVCDTINVEFKSIDDYGRKLSDEKKYSMAADHYKLQAPKFKGTEYYKYLSFKPDNLELLRKAEADASLAVASRPAEAPKTPEAPKPAEPEKPVAAPIAKAEPAAPKPEPAMPAPAMPAPAMPKETPKPAPAMPKDPPKPPPAMPKPDPAMPAPAMPADSKGPFKKPDVLCDCKKIVKGVFCVKCDRLLSPEDMRNGVCKRCEEKPKKIDMCVKRYFMVDGDPSSKSEKPIIKDGKTYDFPYEDKARIVYLCDSCGETADSQYDVKHKPDCASKTVIKVCSKSGTPPHGGEKK